ncbi:pyrin and HIN domain-containing protein 1-like isoform X2 [Sciurus carolinensis]|uniref:pyrin and HIN domain-containing protein 1-like isoform X2 n=1 Tax=Sciurus carolinensis TaxID=30640 RepID=UPI001FB2D883|nr:pyrin and HIN domain-containing protein 1-like isoform X2 [Sciurus carolinensis]
MVNEYKKIVLLIGLEAINDYHFRLIKSLLAKDLKLTRNMQDDFDRIRIADLMEEKFQNDAGLRKLIAVCRDIPALADLAETLEKRRLKVKRKSKGERKSTVKKGQQDETTTAPSTSPTKPDSEPESKEEIPSLKENKIKKSEDPEGMQLPREQRQSLAPSATSKQKTEGCPQTPHGHPPTPFSSPPIKGPKRKKSVSFMNEEEKNFSNLQEVQEMDDTNNQTHDNVKVQESQGQCQLSELSEVGTQTSVSMFHTLETSPRKPSGSLQTPQMPPTAPSGRTHTTDLSPTSSREIQMPHLKITSSSTSSSRMQTPQLSPTSSSRIQTPHVQPAVSSTSLQTPSVSPTSFSSCLLMNRRLTTIPKEASKECGYQKGPKEVMVLKATESFTYEFKECEKRMFHATVATESEFFRVKVFDISLKDKFIPRKVIAISDYIGRDGFLEIYSASSVSDVSTNRKMEISYRLVQIANGTPKIEYLCSQCTVKYVNGVYTVYKKNVREDCTYYEIQDNTGKMEVVVHGRLIYINCEEGDKLKLFCFELAFNEDKWQLRSVKHSYIKPCWIKANS